MKANLKRPATTVEASLEIYENALRSNLTKLLLSNREQPGSVGHPGNFGLRIANFGFEYQRVLSGTNPNSEIRIPNSTLISGLNYGL